MSSTKRTRNENDSAVDDGDDSTPSDAKRPKPSTMDGTVAGEQEHDACLALIDARKHTGLMPDLNRIIAAYLADAVIDIVMRFKHLTFRLTEPDAEKVQELSLRNLRYRETRETVPIRSKPGAQDDEGEAPLWDVCLPPGVTIGHIQGAVDIANIRTLERVQVYQTRSQAHLLDFSGRLYDEEWEEDTFYARVHFDFDYDKAWAAAQGSPIDRDEKFVIAVTRLLIHPDAFVTLPLVEQTGVADMTDS